MLFLSEKIVTPSTLKLLRELMGDKILKDFFLVGGTGLALQLGHRYSIDLDLFSRTSFNTQNLVEHLQDHYGFHLTAVEPNTVLGFISEVKTDFITHDYPLCRPLVQESGIRIASMKDIGAMKLNAIAHSGQRLKDFIDIYYLLEQISLEALLSAYQTKYPSSNLMIPLKALTYFDDINPKMDPPILFADLPLDSIKSRLKIATQNPRKVF